MRKFCITISFLIYSLLAVSQTLHSVDPLVFLPDASEFKIGKMKLHIQGRIM